MNILVQGCQRCGGSEYQVEIIDIFTGLPTLWRCSIPGGDYRYIHRVANVEEKQYTHSRFKKYICIGRVAIIVEIKYIFAGLPTLWRLNIFEQACQSCGD